jgi:site-specific DNA-methyltransferase (adenine-specific)
MSIGVSERTTKSVARNNGIGVSAGTQPSIPNVSYTRTVGNDKKTVTLRIYKKNNDICAMQTNLFGEIEAYSMTIDQAAKSVNVSTATIRNWIKTGYLVQTAKGQVSHESLEKFMSEIAGKEKLNSRANKLLKDEHDHKEVSDKMGLLMDTYKGENIGIEYENSLSDSYRNKEGIYYTPSWVVTDMFKNLEIKPNFTFLDPCCGSGNFLIEAIRQGIAPENVYGFDIDENAVLISKQRIKDEFGCDKANISVGNFLQVAHRLSKEKVDFDLVFTNPPWGKKIDKKEKEKYSAMYGCGSSMDTTSLFFAACLNVLKPRGFLGFLIQEAFFNITTFEDIRRKVIAKKILRFIDYGKAFKGLVTKAQAIVIENKTADLNDNIECSVESKSFSRTLASFEANPRKIFNFWVNETESRVINQLYSVKHITLKDRARWALGIVTGNNDRFCCNEQKDGYLPVYKGADITKTGLKEPNTFIPNDFSSFQQVAPLEMYSTNEKLIYKFISSDLCFFCDTEQRYILNSANLLIPLNVGITAHQLTKLLNSEIINWLFKKLFATHKVLRGDLELLPVHVEYFSQYNDFKEEDYLNYLQIKKTIDGNYNVKK